MVASGATSVISRTRVGLYFDGEALMKPNYNPRSLLLFIFPLLFLLAACNQTNDPAAAEQGSVIDSIIARQELVVVTRNAPTTYYYLHDEQTGFEYDMIQSFADFLGVKARFVIKDTTSEIIEAIENGEAHIAAAGLTITEDRRPLFLFGPEYQQVQQQVVCRRGGANPKNINGLADVDILIPAGTSYEERLQHLKKEHTAIRWRVENGLETEDLLERVGQKKVQCTIADSNIVALNRRYYPELKVRFNLTQPESLAWFMPRKAIGLQAKADEWFAVYKEDGKLDKLIDRYYGYIEVFDYVDTRMFVNRIYQVLPKYQQDFELAAEKNDLDWTLLAAQAYQESHWRANARSPTGVRGIMMLTRTTARELGIDKRTDPQQSIHGGAKYLTQLIKRIPQSVSGEDRIWFALAAYNVGIGHIHDARTLARRMNKNPDLWHEISDVLPLLSKKKYYSTLKYGYARGSEPVRYVQRIRDYHNILLQRLAQR